MDSLILKISKILPLLKEICTVDNSIWIDSDYGGKRFGFLIKKEHISKYPESLDEDFVYGNLLEIYFRMIANFNPISEEFKYVYFLQKGNIALLRKCWFQYLDKVEIEDYDISIDNIDNIEGLIILDYEHAFGNTYDIYDILKVFFIHDPNEELKKDMIIYKEEELIIKYQTLLNNVIDVIYNFFIEEKIDEDLEVKIDLDFVLTENYKRKKKIDKLLSI